MAEPNTAPAGVPLPEAPPKVAVQNEKQIVFNIPEYSAQDNDRQQIQQPPRKFSIVSIHAQRKLSTVSNHTQRNLSIVSNHDIPDVPHVVPEDNEKEHVPPGDNDEIYDRFTSRRKMLITFVVSFCSFLAHVSSTTVLSAVPEVSSTFGCDGSIINLSNALYMLFMGISPMFYGPLGNVYGRKRVRILVQLYESASFKLTQPSQVSAVAASLFFIFSIGTALAPNLAAFFVFRILTAFQGTAFLVIGSSVIGDIYKPTERGTALGWFLSGTLTGPALGTYTRNMELMDVPNIRAYLLTLL
jgi:hypothetical protein